MRATFPTNIIRKTRAEHKNTHMLLQETDLCDAGADGTLICRVWTTQRPKKSIGHQMHQLVYGTYGLQQLNLLLPQQEL
jgi:hypothetical protein